MLMLLDIQEIDKATYLVTLERDGRKLQYEFEREVPGQDLPAGVGPPDQALWDLMDYEYKPPPGKPHGAIYIPALSRVCQLVHRVARGKEVVFPIVLDER